MLKAGGVQHLITAFDLQQVENAYNMQMYVLTALQHLCRLDPQAQYQTVEAGIIPHLQAMIKHPTKQTNPFKQQQADPLKQQALPMLFDLAHVAIIHEHLWENGCAESYIELLTEENWEGSAIAIKTNSLDSSYGVDNISTNTGNPLHAITI